jgi:hypothetical protein
VHRDSTRLVHVSYTSFFHGDDRCRSGPGSTSVATCDRLARRRGWMWSPRGESPCLGHRHWHRRRRSHAARQDHRKLGQSVGSPGPFSGRGSLVPGQPPPQLERRRHVSGAAGRGRQVGQGAGTWTRSPWRSSCVITTTPEPQQRPQNRLIWPMPSAAAASRSGTESRWRTATGGVMSHLAEQPP